MKKILLLSIIFLFTVTSTSVSALCPYSRVGTPMRSVSRPAMPIRPMSVRPSAPARHAVPSKPSTPITTTRSYIYYAYPVMKQYHIHRHVKTAAAPSRLNKDNPASIPTKSFKMNGVTYYN